MCFPEVWFCLGGALLADGMVRPLIPEILIKIRSCLQRPAATVHAPAEMLIRLDDQDLVSFAWRNVQVTCQHLMKKTSTGPSTKMRVDTISMYCIPRQLYAPSCELAFDGVVR